MWVPHVCRFTFSACLQNFSESDCCSLASMNVYNCLQFSLGCHSSQCKSKQLQSSFFQFFRRASTTTFKWSLSIGSNYIVDSSAAACCLQFWYFFVYSLCKHRFPFVFFPNLKPKLQGHILSGLVTPLDLRESFQLPTTYTIHENLVSSDLEILFVPNPLVRKSGHPSLRSHKPIIICFRDIVLYSSEFCLIPSTYVNGIGNVFIIAIVAFLTENPSWCR